ncbi:MAG: hypothetical protein ACTTI2_03210 [Bacteroidales bacterium]
MDRYSQLADLLRSVIGVNKKRGTFFLMETVKVEGDLCTAKIDSLEIPGIRLSAIDGGTEKGVKITPAQGSIILVADISGDLRDLVVLGYTEVERIDCKVGDMSLLIKKDVICLNDGKNDGLVNVNSLVEKLNILEKELNSLKTTFTTWTPVPSDGGSSLKGALMQWSGQSISSTMKSDLEDNKIKH